MKICVVGGGTAGFITATILKEFLDAEITVVYSSKIGIIGVGEGSTEHFSEYMKFVNIDQYSIIKECDATYKSSVYFDGWSSKNYFHLVSSNFAQQYGQYNYLYAHQIVNNETNYVPKSIIENKIKSVYLNSQQQPFNQFHFNTNKLNIFLKNLSESKGITTIDDEIKNIVINEYGNIESVVGEKDTYSADFFIDATGFKRMLIGKLNPKWISFKDHLKMNSAIVFPTSAIDREYNLYTISKAMKYGWMFSIPVWERYGNGYIFDSNYVSLEEAKEEITQSFGNIEFGKDFSFDAGYLENSWINNCASVGLSAAFVEPLEATSIATTIQQSFLLMHRIPSYTSKDIDNYNKKFKNIMENIRDFIFLHYMVKKDTSDFWTDIQKIDPPDSLKEKLEIWENRLPISEDFSGDSDYILFRELNFIVVMDGLGLFNIEKIKKEYNNYPEYVHKFAQDCIDKEVYEEEFSKKFGHRQMIELIRELM